MLIEVQNHYNHKGYMQRHQWCFNQSVNNDHFDAKLI